MRKTALFAALALVATLLAPAGAAPRFTRLGEDPSGDGPPTLDIAFLDVGRGAILTDTGEVDALEIHIGLHTMLPETGGVPDVPAYEWVFTLKSRTFIAEGIAGRNNPRFLLFELMEDGSAQQLEDPVGTFDHADGFIRIAVPLKTIGARRGTVITGAQDTEGGGDVDAHVHHVGTTYVDVMTTTKSFRIP